MTAGVAEEKGKLLGPIRNGTRSCCRCWREVLNIPELNKLLIWYLELMPLWPPNIPLVPWPVASVWPRRLPTPWAVPPTSCPGSRFSRKNRSLPEIWPAISVCPVCVVCDWPVSRCCAGSQRGRKTDKAKVIASGKR